MRALVLKSHHMPTGDASIAKQKWRENGVGATPPVAISGKPISVALMSSKPKPARDVPVGTSWAFRDHRTMAEVMRAEAAAKSA